MNNTTNYRIFVEKLPRFRVEAESLRRELNTNLNLSLGEVRLLCVYDLFGFSEELLEKSRYTVFGEVVTDSVTDTFDLAGRKYIAVEYLPGQFDQRAASAVDCVRLIDPEARVDIRSSFSMTRRPTGSWRRSGITTSTPSNRVRRTFRCSATWSRPK